MSHLPDTTVSHESFGNVICDFRRYTCESAVLHLILSNNSSKSLRALIDKTLVSHQQVSSTIVMCFVCVSRVFILPIISSTCLYDKTPCGSSRSSSLSEKCDKCCCEQLPCLIIDAYAQKVCRNNRSSQYSFSFIQGNFFFFCHVENSLSVHCNTSMSGNTHCSISYSGNIEYKYSFKACFFPQTWYT